MCKKVLGKLLTFVLVSGIIAAMVTGCGNASAHETVEEATAAETSGVEPIEGSSEAASEATSSQEDTSSQRVYELWHHGKKGTAVVECDGKGEVIIYFIDEEGNRQEVSGWCNPDHPEPLTPEEEKEEIERLYNDIEVEFTGGVVTVYFQDQIVDVSDQFVDDICEIELKGSNNYVVYATINRADKSVSYGGDYDNYNEETVAAEYKYHTEFGLWIRGKKVPVKLHYNADGGYAITYYDENGELQGPGGWNGDLEDILKEKGEDYHLTEEEMAKLFSNDYEIVYETDDKIMFYFQDQIIDLSDKFIDGVCELHVYGYPYGWILTLDKETQEVTGGGGDHLVSEPTPEDELARIEHRPVPSYPDEELQFGALRLGENGKVVIQPAKQNDDGAIEYTGEPAGYTLANDAFFFYYPTDGYWGEAVTEEYFLSYLKYHRMGCYYHLNAFGRIDYIRGIPN